MFFLGGWGGGVGRQYVELNMAATHGFIVSRVGFLACISIAMLCEKYE